jgi:hypothetical protein
MKQVKIFCELMATDDINEEVPGDTSKVEMERQWHRGYIRAMNDVIRWIDNPEVVIVRYEEYKEIAKNDN